MRTWGRGVALWCGVLVAAVACPRVPADAHRVSTVCPATSPGVHRSAPGRGRTVALTFDDGPGPSTPRLLAQLRRRRAPATFFNIGSQLGAMPRTVRSEATGFVLGNHTWHHLRLRGLDESAQERELDRTSAETAKLTGRRPCVFRPPFGAFDRTTLEVAHERRLAVWLWSVDPEDWKAAGSASAYWVHRIVRRAEAGIGQRHPVIILHNMGGRGSPATVRALPAIIAFYRAHGYRFVGV